MKSNELIKKKANYHHNLGSPLNYKKNTYVKGGDMQRVKDNPINNRLIQLYIKIFPKIEDFNMEIFYDEILVLKISPF